MERYNYCVIFMMKMKIHTQGGAQTFLPIKHNIYLQNMVKEVMLNIYFHLKMNYPIPTCFSDVSYVTYAAGTIPQIYCCKTNGSPGRRK